MALIKWSTGSRYRRPEQWVSDLAMKQFTPDVQPLYSWLGHQAGEVYFQDNQENYNRKIQSSYIRGYEMPHGSSPTYMLNNNSQHLYNT